MRVVHVSHSAQPGGSNAVLLSLLRHAPAHVAASCVFLEDGPALAAARGLGTEARLIATGRAREPWRAPGAIARLRRAVAGADVVLAHVAKAAPYAAAAAGLAGVPFAWWQHQHLGQDAPLQALAGRTRPRLVVCSADWVAAEQLARFPRTPIEVVHPGIELPDPLPPPRSHREGPVVLGVVGRLQRWKRVELALEALVHVPGARLQVVGDAWRGLDADYPGVLRERAAALGIEERVGFAGHVAGAAAAMRDLDVLVHTAEREPFGMVCAEALLHGVPVIAAPGHGPSEVVRDGVDGLLTGVEDAHALAAAVRSLADDPGRRAAMGEAGRTRVLARFTAERMAARLYGLLDRITR